MPAPQSLRRLIDLPGVADLEFKSVMKPGAQEPENRADFPEIDACSMEIFGLTADEALAVPRPEGWDHIEDKPVSVQVAAFEREGWDVTDNKRRPLRMFHQLNQQLWLAIRGVAGTLPFHAGDDDNLSPLASSLAREAARFRRR
jgi:hypothetical protein